MSVLRENDFNLCDSGKQFGVAVRAQMKVDGRMEGQVRIGDGLQLFGTVRNQVLKNYSVVSVPHELSGMESRRDESPIRQAN